MLKKSGDVHLYIEQIFLRWTLKGMKGGKNIWYYVGWEEKGVLGKCMTLGCCYCSGEVLTCRKGRWVWALSCRKPSHFGGEKIYGCMSSHISSSVPVLWGCCLLHWQPSRPAQASWIEGSNCIALLAFRENLRHLEPFGSWPSLWLLTQFHSIAIWEKKKMATNIKDTTKFAPLSFV